MKWIAWSNVTVEAASRLSTSLPTSSEGAVQSNSLDWVPPDQRSAIAVKKAKADLAVCLRILDGGLEGKSFLLDDYSLVDTHLQALVGWISTMDVDLIPFPNVIGWLQRCSERPAIAKLMAD